VFTGLWAALRRLARSSAGWLVAGAGLALVVAVVVVAVSSDTNGVTEKEKTAKERERSLPLRRRFLAKRSGIAVRYPAGWRVTTHNETPVPNPALCFTVRARRAPLSARATVKLVEYLPPELDRSELRDRDDAGDLIYPHRAGHFRLSMLQSSHVTWTRGKLSYFQERGRVFYIGVVLASRASGETRQTVAAVIDSLRVQRKGRCRPTSGIGAHGS
jgi:hypothetical protein